MKEKYLKIVRAKQGYLQNCVYFVTLRIINQQIK